MALDRRDVYQILNRIKYKDWSFLVSETGDYSFTLQVAFTDGGEAWHGRKWLISHFASVSEVAQTALFAVLAAEEHEARERFLVDGKAIFHPHHKLDDLLAIADRVDVRAPMPAANV